MGLWSVRVELAGKGPNLYDTMIDGIMSALERTMISRHVVGYLGRKQRAYLWREDDCIPDSDIIFLAKSIHF